jgi:hypothetical protein
VTIFDTAVHTDAGDFRLTIQDGSTVADLVVTGPSDKVTVYCSHGALTRLASATGAASHKHLTQTEDVETDNGVVSVDQPAGLIVVMPTRDGADIAVDDCAGHIVDGSLTPLDCERLTVAFAAASHNL